MVLFSILNLLADAWRRTCTIPTIAERYNHATTLLHITRYSSYRALCSSVSEDIYERLSSLYTTSTSQACQATSSAQQVCLHVFSVSLLRFCIWIFLSTVDKSSDGFSSKYHKLSQLSMFAWTQMITFRLATFYYSSVVSHTQRKTRKESSLSSNSLILYAEHYYMSQRMVVLNSTYTGFSNSAMLHVSQPHRCLLTQLWTSFLVCCCEWAPSLRRAPLNVDCLVAFTHCL